MKSYTGLDKSRMHGTTVFFVVKTEKLDKNSWH